MSYMQAKELTKGLRFKKLKPRFSESDKPVAELEGVQCRSHKGAGFESRYH